MADWKQITARIRRARTSKDPAGQLSNLYEKTRDAMVAFELAKYFETSGQNSDAAKWYSAAAAGATAARVAREEKLRQRPLRALRKLPRRVVDYQLRCSMSRSSQLLPG